MDLVNVALQIIAIIAIIAVGAFIIVFLSDLLISIIDDHQGIFFRRNKGRQEQNDRTSAYTESFNNSKINVASNNMTQKNFEFDDELKREEFKKEQINSFRKSNIDLEAAKKEQEMIEKANKSFFDEEDVVVKEETPEDLAQKERIAKLEERNRQLEDELKQKETAKSAPEQKMEMPKFEPKFADMPKETINNDEEPAEDEMDSYEKLIKQINNEVKADMDGTSKTTVKPVETPQVKSTDAKMSLFEDFEEDVEEEEQEDEQYKSLTEELAALKLQLETEKKEREQFKLEAEERTQKIIEEKQKLEEALNAKKVVETENKKGVNTFLDSEEEYMARLEILEERLREAKKQLRHNKREFVPLNKIKRTLEKDEIKLRRKEAQVAKQKVLLFGVNNNEIDAKKQAELEQEIDMLEGLKLSVQHCEDVMRENADRYPVLEQTHQILMKNVRNLNSDIENINEKLKELRKKKE